MFKLQRPAHTHNLHSVCWHKRWGHANSSAHWLMYAMCYMLLALGCFNSQASRTLFLPSVQLCAAQALWSQLEARQAGAVELEAAGLVAAVDGSRCLLVMPDSFW